jgi:hypothetical protein
MEMTPEEFKKLSESENHREQLTDTLFDEQYERIKDAYGEEAAENANYGWGTDYRDDEHFAACTKIYLRPRNMALTSEANYSTNEIKHADFELA